ncbi:MAG: ATP-binding protein [Bacteroidota bacterium]
MNAGEGMVLHFSIAGGDFAAAGEASSRIKATLRQVGLSADLIRRIAIATYEAEMNVVIHATAGQINVRINPTQVEVETIDRGPGIPDIELAMREGYSTAPQAAREMGFGAGMGLPNMKRCADKLVIESQVGHGTTVRLRFDLKGGH